MKIGFDNEEYVRRQSEQILKRTEQFDNKLYLEFGGKLFDDYHASRVLPGFDINGKVKLLQKLKDQAEIIICINAADIEKNKIRADIGITYDQDVLRLIDNLRGLGLYVSAIIIAQYKDQPSADVFKKKLDMRGERTYIHKPISGYPTNIDLIVSDGGYGANPYVETTRPIVVVTAPGPGSGKMATCLSQLYHEYKRNVKAGYAKFETFPIWNLPLKHPVNLAYEAATADLNDVNMIDSYHLEAYGKTTVNYNRDIEIFPVVNTILTKITGSSDVYKSPTDMGVNMAGYCIFDDETVKEAAKQEIIRRYYKSLCDYKQSRGEIEAVHKIELIMQQLNLKTEDRKVVAPALKKAEKTGVPCMAIELENGEIVTGKATTLLNASSTLLINAIKTIAGISDEILLLSPIVLGPMQNLKSKTLGDKNIALNLEETLIALSICAATNPTVELAMTKLEALRGLEAHGSYMISSADESIFRRLGVNITCEAEFSSKNLYYV